MAKTKRKVRPKEPQYIVHCRPPVDLFTFGSMWRLSHLMNRLNELLARVDFVPGLVLRDGKDVLWKPELQVHLVPVEPEESDVVRERD